MLKVKIEMPVDSRRGLVRHNEVLDALQEATTRRCSEGKTFRRAVEETRVGADVQALPVLPVGSRRSGLPVPFATGSNEEGKSPRPVGWTDEGEVDVGRPGASPLDLAQ